MALGKSCATEGVYGDATPFSKNSVDISERICERLTQNGFSRTGTEMMISGITGEPFKARIFIGPTYYQRLKHLVSEKIHARREGAVANLSRQPTSGRSRNGGLRLSIGLSREKFMTFVALMI